ncbi:hypothetical protein V1L54_22045 [Streptomyces sp. TRM 70361]|uniref:hypothetical protein n=1 Tax=Streptomyces sp. TRM 70361 TaxID=3116553 RepID=UPI002E7BB355|nr:hypothetical protein [Streptomyces sp. TRM 70361]MEE1942046.1 hypothetical protein [Streptomyces sp. TRM 70361]
METQVQREARRTISAWLTKQINTSTQNAYPQVRAEIITALQRIDERLKELNDSLHEKYSIRKPKKLVKFYMKGGNAFACVREPNGLNATTLGGGDSDWDTQIVVDPWTPLPVQDQLYSLIQEIVLEEMVKAGVAVAAVIGALAEDVGAAWERACGDIQGDNLENYRLSCDEPQVLRQVYDPQRIGLWMNDRRKLKDPESDKPVPGIVFNDAIRPFAIYRLGYTWRAEREQGEYSRTPRFDCDIEKPILMELIDVTLPRRNTVEAVTVWEELEQGHVKVESCSVTVAHPHPVCALVPLPDISYHLREISTMMCEIADGTSRHQDKLSKRFGRFKVIWDDRDEAGKADIVKVLSALAGVGCISAETPEHNDHVTQAITGHGAEIAHTVLADTDPAFRLARKLMDIVAARSQAAAGDFTERGSVAGAALQRFDDARANLESSFAELLVLPEGFEGLVIEHAPSDDLALLKLVEENEYLDVTRIQFSGVDRAAVVRVPNQLALDAVANAILAGLDPIKLDPEHTGPPKKTVRFREHRTVRRGGISYEKTMVVFGNGRAEAYITLTTAGQQDAPFVPAPGDAGVRCASLAEIASQRLVAAALIEDYVIRTAIGRQYEALKTLLRDV